MSWSEMLRTAAALGVPPPAFWAMSLREWRMLTARPATAEPMDRDLFERLSEAWPDE
jgi:uncharacterized phage protein (TIGR02216 family)